jgi:uncharacterized membrane protein YhhN
MSRVRGSGAVLAVLAVVAGLVYLAPTPWLAGPGRAIVKAIPVLMLAAWVAINRPAAPAWLVTVGLAASAAGDILLDLGASTFLPGVGAFALAHVLYTAAFTLMDGRLRPLAALPFVAWGALVVWRVMPGLGPEAAPVILYVAIITAMMWRSAAQAAGVSSRGAWFGVVGAVLFGASDTLIALGRWGRLVADGRLVMLLYWAGQAGIASWAVATGAVGNRRRRNAALPDVVKSMCERAGRPPEREESPGSGGQGAR